MKILLQRLGCSALLAFFTICTMAGTIHGLFERRGSSNSLAPFFPTIDIVNNDSNTIDAMLPKGLNNNDIYVGFNTDFEGTSDPLNILSDDKLLGGYIPKPDNDRVIMGDNSSTDNNQDNTGSSGNNQGTSDSSSNADTNVGTIDTPVVIGNTNLATIIKSNSYTSGLDIFQSSRNDISTDTTALLNAINNDAYATCSFIAVRISDGATIAYNANALYRCASSYKALASLFAYKQAEAGAYNLNTALTYTVNDYYSGSGVIKSSAYGTMYTLGTLADYSIRYSDNIAYTMLQRYINKDQLSAYAASLGCPNYSKFAQTNWPDVSAVDSALWWAEIYNFANNSTYGKQLYNVFLHATNPVIKKALGNQYPVAHKSGSMYYYYHDAGIVHSEDPYLLVVLSYDKVNYSNVNQNYVAPVIQEIDKLINP